MAKGEDDALVNLSALEHAEAQLFNDEYLPTALVGERDLQQELYLRRNPRFEELRLEYAALWAEIAIRRSRQDDVDRVVDRVVANRERYESVGETTGIPWYVIGAIHNLESSLSFRGHLHNGDPLTARTVRVPAGRPRTGQPPFRWEQSAADALEYKGLAHNRDWSIEKIAYLLEGYNGWGYRLYHPEVKTPYLWSFSNHYTRGKYVADGRWSSTAVSEQCGAIVLLRRLDELGVIRVRTLPVPELSNGSSPDEVDFADSAVGNFIQLHTRSILERYPGLAEHLDDLCIRVSSGEEVCFRGERYLLVTQAGEHDGGQLLFRYEDDGTLEPVFGDTLIDFAVFGSGLGELGTSLRCGPSTADEHRTVYEYMLSQVNVFSSRSGPDNGNLACVWAVRHIVRNALHRWITRTDGTAVFAPELRACFGKSSFEESEVPAGGLIISPSRQVPGERRRRIGHVGILGEHSRGDRLIYSNSSARARWEQNFTLSKWIQTYRLGKGLSVYFFPLPSHTV